MATKHSVITLTDKSIHIRTQQNKFKNKTQLEINNLFFIPDQFISRKQFFQIIDMGYDIQSFIIGQFQYDRSI